MAKRRGYRRELRYYGDRRDTTFVVRIFLCLLTSTRVVVILEVSRVLDVPIQTRYNVPVSLLVQYVVLWLARVHECMYRTCSSTVRTYCTLAS